MKFYKNITLHICCAMVVILLSWSCAYFRSTNLTFVNESRVYVDSVGFTLNNYKCEMLIAIAPGATVKKIIYPDSIRLNSHDIVVHASIYVKGKLFKYLYDYNDLYGSLDKGYKLVLKADSSAQISSEY